jgi:hypothetical protein
MGDLKSVELKRVVMVKVIVTETFKNNMIKEIEHAISNLEKEEQNFDKQSDLFIKEMSLKGQFAQITELKKQLEQEKLKRDTEKMELNQKINHARLLKIDSEVIQGQLEGPVEVKVGDNLYQKVGGTEIVIKDGVIQSITEH